MVTHQAALISRGRSCHQAAQTLLPNRMVGKSNHPWSHQRRTGSREEIAGSRVVIPAECKCWMLPTRGSQSVEMSGGRDCHSSWRQELSGKYIEHNYLNCCGKRLEPTCSSGTTPPTYCLWTATHDGSKSQECTASSYLSRSRLCVGEAGTVTSLLKE